jgi:hypothetical protein
MARKHEPCAALAEVIQPKLPFGPVSGPYSYLPLDLGPLSVLLMQRSTDSPDDDDGVIADFCQSFGFRKRAVVAAIRAYRHASRTVN